MRVRQGKINYVACHVCAWHEPYYLSRDKGDVREGLVDVGDPFGTRNQGNKDDVRLWHCMWSFGLIEEVILNMFKKKIEMVFASCVPPLSLRISMARPAEPPVASMGSMRMT